MPRPRSLNRDKAKQLWLKSGKERLLKDIAEELQVSEEQVRKWKNQDQWNKVTLPNTNSNVTKQKGAQPGNKNSIGGPPGNKKAIKTGEFETLFFDALDPDELQLIQAVQPDKEQLLLQEIQLLTVRERRMLKRIDNLRRLGSDTYGSDDPNAPPPGMTVVKYSSGLEKGQPTELKEFEGILGQIQSIEDALTRVQARRQRAIETLHKFGYDDARLELIKAQINKLTGNNQEIEDMEAIEGDIYGAGG